MGSGPGGGGGNHRAQFNHDDDTLPEWATEHADGGGSFDASGAFHHITGQFLFIYLIYRVSFKK